MSVQGKPLTAHPPGNKARYLLVVAGNAPDLCEYLRRDFAGDEKVDVVLDRRQGERRQRAEPRQPERRRWERRWQPASPRSDWFVVARLQTD